jgi:hypothetical protein
MKITQEYYGKVVEKRVSEEMPFSLSEVLTKP